MNRNRKIDVLSPSQKPPGSQWKAAMLTTGSQPPRNRRAHRLLIRIILAYSPRKKRANPIDEYSTLYPATSSASASGRSKGARFVSARQEIKNSTRTGNNGTPYHIPDCASTISDMFNDPAHRTTVIMISPRDTS